METNFANLINFQSKKLGDKVALYDREELTEPWKELSWNTFSKKVDTAASAFLHLGIKVQDRVGQFSQNKTENFIVDFGLFSVRAINVPIYATSSLDQLKFIVDDSEIEYLFVGEQDQYNVAIKLFENKTTLKKIIVFDKKVQLTDAQKCIYFDDFLQMGTDNGKTEEVEKLRKLAEEKDLASIIYTSGTTGNPKGVMMTHEMYNEAVRIHFISLPEINPSDVSIAFLPPCFSALCIYQGL